ncbi:M81 family metallopeptidase [Larkinella bovis]|uniref:M81 family metallopeptidase n=1 Tax=Larkinella bovis TaxID=683041 RepID=A0ABW0IK13_9BACT
MPRTKKRIALLGIYHETNTFSRQPTTLEHFKSSFWLEKDAITSEYRGAHHEISGIIEVFEGTGDFELVPVFYTAAIPGGLITAGAFQAILDRLFELLDETGPFDGVVVVPHGAGVAESHPDMDGHWLHLLRQKVGIDVPITGTLDPHANVSPLMVSVTNGLFPYQTNPHIDQARAGRAAGRMMIDILANHKKFSHRLLQLPLAISIEQQHTSESPCLDLLQAADSIRSASRLYSISLLLGFPYADVREMGSAFILIAESDADVHQAERQLLAYVSEHLSHFNGKKVHIQELIPDFAEMEKPILLLDMGDNVGGGSTGSSTYLLEALDAAGLSKTFICLYDPAAVQTLQKSSEVPLSLRVGENSYPIRPKSYRMIEGKFKELSPRHGGFVNYDMGESAIVKTVNGQTVMLTSLRTVPFSMQQLLAYDLQPETFDFIVAKGVNAPIAAYRDACKQLVKVDTPGDTSADMTRFKFNARRTPLFPFEEPTNEAFRVV